MSETAWYGVIMFGTGVTVIVVGLVTGEMPGSYVEFDRQNHPARFWAMGAVWSLIAVIGISIFIRELATAL